ncbi:MAG TPA: hypothetical protein VI489_05360 [Candidatus Brocadiaceae bacterium]
MAFKNRWAAENTEWFKNRWGKGSEEGDKFSDVEEQPEEPLVETSPESVEEFLSVALNLTSREKNEYIATVLSESDQGNVQPNAIAWVYYNLMVANGVQKGLDESSAHNGKAPQGWYKGYMTGLGETDYKDQKLPEYIYKYDKNLKGKTYTDYVQSEYYKQIITPRVNKTKNYIENTILKNPASNPYPGFTRQGYWGDLNQLSGPSKKDATWKMARAYFWLQKEGKVKNSYVVEFKAGKKTTFIFHQKNVEAYFKKNKLPDDVPLYDWKTGDKKK